MPDWIRKPGTTAHTIRATLRDKNGPVDLPDGTTVNIRVKSSGSAAALLNAQATVVSPGALVGDPNRGVVEYAQQSGDLVPGIYDVDFLAVIPGLGVQHFPEDDFQILLVQEGADQV